MRVSYSVAIRTLGTAGKKYELLMKSISHQTVLPEKVIVVLPEGYKPPERIIGNEEFVFCQKGMVTQRLEALKYIDSEFTLFCDDDIELDSYFVERVLEPLNNKGYDCSTGPLLELLPPQTLKSMLKSVLGRACVMLRGRNRYYVRILKTGGWSYNRNIDQTSHRIYETESCCGGCFMVRTAAMKKICFEDEIWIGRNGYDAYEDQGMIYKLFLNEYRICVVSDAVYLHHDAGASKQGLKLEPIYAFYFNHYIFWYRFLFSQEKTLAQKLWDIVCVKYFYSVNRMNMFIHLFLGKIESETYKVAKKGYRDAKKYILSDEYQNIPSPVIQTATKCAVGHRKL